MKSKFKVNLYTYFTVGWLLMAIANTAFVFSTTAYNIEMILLLILPYALATAFSLGIYLRVNKKYLENIQDKVPNRSIAWVTNSYILIVVCYIVLVLGVFKHDLLASVFSIAGVGLTVFILGPIWIIASFFYKPYVLEPEFKETDS